MVPKTLPFAMPLLVAAVAFSGSTLADAREADEKQPVLVQMRGRFVGITATNKPYLSLIFEFQVAEQLNGPGQAPTAKEQLLKFELSNGQGLRELLAKLGGEKKLEDIVRDLPKGPRYDVVFWLEPSRATPVGLPVSVVEKPR